MGVLALGGFLQRCASALNKAMAFLERKHIMTYTLLVLFAPIILMGIAIIIAGE
jgi:hypothetical protein